jgi:colanic acid biosynthesis protein WcaH
VDCTIAELALTMTEVVGSQGEVGDARHLGLYEHFYYDSIYTDESKGVDVSTHYVVNGFEVVLTSAKNLTMNTLPAEQHGAYQWFSEEALMASY